MFSPLLALPERLCTRASFLIVLWCLFTPAVATAQLGADVYIGSGLTLPVALIQDPDNPAVQFVVEQTGKIRIIQSGVLQPGAFLDLSGVINCCGERGLLGLAFAPDSATSRRFFVNFTNGVGDTVIARFKRSSGDPLVADPASRFDLRWGSPGGLPFIQQPYANHNGGTIAFGPDGYLYIGMGDGGAGGDPLRLAQDPAYLLGKMLRIDVSVPDTNPQGYAVPADNPFIGASTPTHPEIWSFGFRNPWKFSFDDAAGGTGALIIGDVGESSWEEIDYEPANRGGRNYGWVRREGMHPTGVTTITPGAPSTLTDPIHEYNRALGVAVTGGYVYRGTALGPLFEGRYFFADFGMGRVWSAGLAIDSITGDATVLDVIDHTAQLGGRSAVGNVSSFGRDAQGELYLVQYGGSIAKLRTRVHSVVLQPDRVAPQAPGTTITWTASASGGRTPYEYKWLVYDGAAWTFHTDWTTSNTFNWTPTQVNPNYYVGVWIRSNGNTSDAAEAPHSVPYAIGGPSAANVTLTADRIAPQTAGTTINFSTAASGGTAPHQYKWWVHDGVTWTAVTGWTSTSTFAWTPVSNANYSVRAWIRSAGNSVDAPEGSASMAFPIGTTLRVTAVVLASDLPSPQSSGTTITWTATPSGGFAPHQYKWWVYDGSAWMMATGWTSSNTFAWTPASNRVYYIGVWVKSAGNTDDAAEMPHSVPFTIAQGTSVTLTANRTSPQAPGTTITWAASAAGGIAPHQYKWWVNDGSTWAIAMDWSGSASFAWTPPVANANYSVRVWVRSAGNPADAAEASSVAAFPIATSAITTSVTLIPSVASPQPPGTTITWTATPSGGVSPHQYKWWIYNGAAWTMATAWTASNTFTWTPLEGHEYYVGVWVRSAGNANDAAEVPHSVPYTISGSTPTVTAVSLVPDRASPQAPGTTITWTATPTGGIGPHQYKWWIYDGTMWTMATGWATTNTLAWTPATANQNYYVGVWVKSAGNGADAAEFPHSVAFRIQ